MVSRYVNAADKIIRLAGQVAELRERAEKLRKGGMGAAADECERLCKAAEKRLTSQLGKRSKARTRARRQSRTSTGRFA